MIELTVGYVAGIIAAVATIVRIWSPNTLVYVISGLLGDNNSAATWSVAGRALQNSYWPELVQSDTALSRNVRWDIRLLVGAIRISTFLIAIAGIITPLGLYSVAGPGSRFAPEFHYVLDSSAFGQSTPPRSDMPLARTCSDNLGWIPCPYTNDIVIFNSTKDGRATWFAPNNLTTNVPEALMKIFSSGTAGFPSTISNYFDIEWRQYTRRVASGYNNGTEFLAGAYRQMESLITSNEVKAVEGLIVDSVDGGIGFRRHTLPKDIGRGAYWEEDLLYIQPETACVNTNLTLDFVVPNNSSLSIVSKLRLVDRGGFVDLNHTYPYYDHDNAQSHADLHGRAYKAAWMNNAFSMAYLNVTNMANETTGEKAFRYVNSTKLQSFPMIEDIGVTYNSVGLSQVFGSYLVPASGVLASTGDKLYSNPFKVTSDEFQSAAMICRGAGASDIANISNIMIGCGLMRGAAVRTNAGPQALFDAGSEWSIPMYACATSVKATIKTTSFMLNGTDGIPDLKVTSVRPKVYATNESVPLWAVEESGLNVRAISPLWGLISPVYADNYPNISVIRNESLHLPGWVDTIYRTSLATGSAQNLPASDFPVQALISTYDMGKESSLGRQIDYTGYTNMALYVKWQNLSSNPEDAAKIVNLIWTDFAAAAVVGTKSVLGPRNVSDPVHIIVRPIVTRIRYRWVFGIPAFIVLLLCIVIAAFALGTFVFRRHNIQKVKKHLHQTAAGRIYTSFLYPEYTNLDQSSRAWNKAVGMNKIELGGDNPMMTLLARNNFHKGNVTTESKSEVVIGEAERFLGPRSPSPYTGASPVSPMPQSPPLHHRQVGNGHY